MRSRSRNRKQGTEIQSEPTHEISDNRGDTTTEMINNNGEGKNSILESPGLPDDRV